MKFYNAGDYRSAIREFADAQQLAPADLNNYNLALCYDKLGDAEPAIQYYRAFLDRQPSTDKRAEIEASISRLEAASRSAAVKKAEEARRAEEMRKAEEARAAEDARRAEDARKAEEARAAEARAAEDARKAEEARRAAAGPAVGTPGVGPAPMPGAGGAAVGAGSTGTPGSGAAVSTGDAQLDRVQQIDIGAIRDQRMGGAGGAGGAAADPRAPNPGAGPRVAAAEPPPAGGAAPAGGMPAPDDKPKAKPVYKKWWFWAVVGVSAYVLVSIATQDSAKAGTATNGLTLAPQPPAAQPGGLTLMRW